MWKNKGKQEQATENPVGKCHLFAYLFRIYIISASQDLRKQGKYFNSFSILLTETWDSLNVMRITKSLHHTVKKQNKQKTAIVLLSYSY